MSWQYHPLLILFGVGGLVSLVVAGYCWQYMQQHGRSYLVGSVGLLGFNNAIWVFAAMLKTASTNLDASLLFYKIEFVGVVPNTVVAIILALAYVGKYRLLTQKNIALLSLIPATFLVLIIVNPDQVMIVDPRFISASGIRAFEHEFPPLFTLYLAWVFGSISLAIGIIAWGFIKDRVPAIPAGVGITVLFLPSVTNLLKITGIFPPGGDGINITPAASAIGISIFAFVIIKHRMFDVIPVGRELAIESMESGYILIGPEQNILDTNPAANRLLEPQFSDDLKNKPIDEVLPEFEELTPGNPVDIEIGDRTLAVRASTVSRHQESAGKVLLLEDVTDQRQREHKLQRRNERLDQFASTISHDLRNPLNVVQGQLALARKECESDHLDTAEEAAQRMETLIDDVLTLARAGDTIEEPEPVDLGELTDSCWENVTTAEATLVVETEQIIQADSSRVKQLLENLFRNAIEHAGPDVTVTVGDVADGFYVSDDGPGIQPDERDTVFEAGYSTQEENTGFGLQIVREIAEAHGWSITITESETGGARFEFTDVHKRS